MASNKNTVDPPPRYTCFCHSPWVLLVLQLSNIAPQKILGIAVLHKQNRAPASKHGTQPIRLNSNPEPLLWVILHPSLYTLATGHSRPVLLVPYLDCPSYPHFKKQFRNHLLSEAFLVTSTAAPSFPPLRSHDSLGRSPLYHSPYFIIVNCVHICLPHWMRCLPFKGKDDVLPIPHPSGTQQSVRHRVSN